jgi:uncharacterized protein YcbK (DUF882 family)
MVSGRPIASLHAANEELRRLRKSSAREGRRAIRFVIAGDPTKPVMSLAIPARLLSWLGTATALGALVAALVAWGKPAHALRALAEAFATDAEAAAPAPADSRESMDFDRMMLPRSEAVAVPDGRHFTVEIVNTGRTLKVKLGGRAGEPDEESYRALRHELRCQRSGAETPIDPRLIDLLYRIAVESNSRIQIVSAFRAQFGPGKLNYHTKGMAADIRVPGLGTEELRDLARSLGATGVGYYPTVQFVHVDVRPVPYFWTDTSGHGERGHGDDERIESSESGAVSPVPDEPQ